MSKPLIIVESPTKVRTIKKYMGNDFNVSATVGHIKDLPEKEIGIDVEKGFKPKYKNIPGKQKVISALKSAAGDAMEIYLAPDPDREGEAIAWHTAEVLKKKGRKFYRVLFHELTKNAIKESMASPEELDKNKYEAQQARRILDRLVGYQISPLLWKKVKRGLSAGRVQSVSVRIICERERAIQAFDPEEYWSITAYLAADEPPPFTAKLGKKNGKKLHIPDKATTDAILKDLKNEEMVVESVKKRTIKRQPQPPFITSKLQQEAIRKLRFSAKKAMSVAQQLYEGIELGPKELVGLITYMRTDSTRIAQEAAEEALDHIKKSFGADYVPDKPRFFKNKKKAQDAHEAIRPTSVYHTPESVAPFLNKDQLALYRLIWQRFVASQMNPALIDNVSVAIKSGDYTFQASGSTVKFAGFTVLYMTADQTTENEKKKEQLPTLVKGQILTRDKLDPKQHFTVPPPRFTEASLVKELEENGIGRPSTYASILTIIRSKGYVELVKGQFIPGELGFIVNDLMVKSFPDVMNVEFTAKLEDDLDRIEAAEVPSLDILERFYDHFKKELDIAAESMQSVKGEGLPTDLTCPDCGKELFIKVGKNGHFLACCGYPDCSWTRDYVRDEKGKIQAIEPPPLETVDKDCDKCGKPMIVKRGRYGNFLACTGYPECKHTLSISQNGGLTGTGVKCPNPGCEGEIVEKRSRRGKIFYGCNKYPGCDYATWDKPVDKKCPDCDFDFLLEKTTKRKGTFLTCPQKDCSFEESL